MVVGDFPVETELAVIGGGPAGVAAALRAAELGMEAVLVEPRGRPGGTWVDGGALATREIGALAATVQAARRAATAGLHFDAPRVDLAELRIHLEREALAMSDDAAAALQHAGIPLIHGAARFVGSRRLVAEGDGGLSRVKFRHAILATGCRAAPHPAQPAGCPHVTDAAGLLALDEVPRTLLVVGGGSSAVELAMSWAFLGTAVTLVTNRSEVLDRFDAPLRNPVIHALDEALEGIHTQVTLVGLEPDGAAVRPTFAGENGPKAATFDHVLLSSQRVANLDALGLDATQVQCDADGFALVSDTMATSDPRIFAIGDCTGRPHVATRAVMQGRVAAEVICGWKSAYDARAVPITIHTVPEIAACGYDEQTLREAGIPFAIKGSTSGRGAAQVTSRILHDPDTGLILGVGLVGANACEAIGEGVLAIEMGAVLDDLAATLHPRASSSAALGEAAREPADG